MYNWFRYYVTDHYLDELNLRDNQDAITKLASIRRFMLLFMIVNTLAVFYAFYSLFHQLLLAFAGTVIFQFIYLMMYIVLFSTVRLAEYARGEKLKKVNVEVELSGKKYNGTTYTGSKNADGFILQKIKGLKEKFITNKSWSNAMIRSVQLILLGTGPAFFFALMIHHPITSVPYEIEKEKYISSQIYNMQETGRRNNSSRIRELDSLASERSALVRYIDSLKSVIAPDISQIEEREWMEQKLKVFDDIYSPKIIRLQEQIVKDSVYMSNRSVLLKAHFSKADFFILRAKITWQKYWASFIILILVFLFLMIYPFVRRYSLMINETELIDLPQEEKYRNIIQESYEKQKRFFKETLVYRILQEQMNDPLITEQEKNEIAYRLSCYDEPGQNFIDPVFRSIPKEDGNIFLDKGSLGKYLGH
jgi:hypothetical protein